MDVHYLVPSEESLGAAMDKFTDWLDQEIEAVFANADQKEKGFKSK